MSTTTAAHQPPVSNLDERDRQMKQEEMIRQYLQVANTETTPPASTSKGQTSLIIGEQDRCSSLAVVPVSFDFHDLRKEVKLGEERVERLRQELRDLQTKRDESFVRTPPPYTFPTGNNPPGELLHQQLSPPMNLRLSDRATPPPPALMQEVRREIIKKIEDHLFVLFSFTLLSSKVQDHRSVIAFHPRPQC